jgi:cell division protein FtsB
MKVLPIRWKYVLMAALMIVAALLILDLNGRIVALNRLSKQRDQLQKQVLGLQATATALADEVAYATSQAAVDQWAREEGHMTRPGDVLVIPIPPPGATSVPVFVPTPVPQKVENWQIWWALFMGE